MKVKVTTYIKPLFWDNEPDEVAIYDLENEMQKRLFTRDMTNIFPNEYITVEVEKEGE